MTRHAARQRLEARGVEIVVIGDARRYPDDWLADVHDMRTGQRVRVRALPPRQEDATLAHAILLLDGEVECEWGFYGAPSQPGVSHDNYPMRCAEIYEPAPGSGTPSLTVAAILAVQPDRVRNN